MDDLAGELEAGERDDTGLERERAAGLELNDLHIVMLAGGRVHDAFFAERDGWGHSHRGDIGIPLTPAAGVGPDAPDPVGGRRRLA